MACACIDIGSNTTRLLVAEATGEHLTELLQQRAYTRLGRHADREGRIDPVKVAELADVVATQVRVAGELGAERLRVVGTAALRDARNRKEIAGALREAAGVELEVLSEADEARLAFAGATRTLSEPPHGRVGVVDVGGGSSELVAGTYAGGVEWLASFRIGSGVLADAYLRSDPPSAAELQAVRQHVAGVFEGLEVPHCDHVVAVGGSATSLRRLVGGVLDADTLGRGLRVLSSGPADDVARRFQLDAVRVRLLPAGMLVLEAAAECFGQPLHIGRGGLREGVVLELIAMNGAS